jgi:hypothetical protein
MSDKKMERLEKQLEIDMKWECSCIYGGYPCSSMECSNRLTVEEKMERQQKRIAELERRKKMELAAKALPVKPSGLSHNWCGTCR